LSEGKYAKGAFYGAMGGLRALASPVEALAQQFTGPTAYYTDIPEPYLTIPTQMAAGGAGLGKLAGKLPDVLGKIPGALPMSALNLIGSAKTPVPSIYVSFRSFAGDCENKLQCAVGVHDTSLGTGQGSHGSLSRAETRNFMAAVGPSFKSGFADPAPISNADITPTLAHVAGITLAPKGKLTGRVISEALAGGGEVKPTQRTLQSTPAANGMRTILNLQEVGDTRYFDAAGFAGKAVGLNPP
jgi:hypothetical protein